MELYLSSLHMSYLTQETVISICKIDRNESLNLSEPINKYLLITYCMS